MTQSASSASVGPSASAAGSLPPIVPGWEHRSSGKVRDVYAPTSDGPWGGQDVLLVVASDRISAYDHILATPIPDKGKVLTALVNGVNARSSGLSTIPPEHMHEATWFLQDALMFVGGGSASTAGGIKVTTFAVLLLAILAEARGDQDIEAFGRRITPSTVRLSVAVAFIGSSIIGLATLLLLQMTNLSLDRILFEVISAFATVGLSTGITPSLPDGAKYVIVALMFVGRVGTMTAASALALRERRRVIRMPEASPMIG